MNVTVHASTRQRNVSSHDTCPLLLLSHCGLRHHWTNVDWRPYVSVRHKKSMANSDASLMYATVPSSLASHWGIIRKAAMLAYRRSRTGDSNCIFVARSTQRFVSLSKRNCLQSRNSRGRHFGAEPVSCYHRGLWAAKLGSEGDRFAKSTGAVL